MKVIVSLRNKCAALCAALSTVFLIYCAVIIVVQVVMRYVFGTGIVWSEAIARYTIIWSIMLMGSVLIKDDDLIRADFFDTMLPKAFLKVRDIIYQIFIFAIFCLLVYFGYKFALNGQSLDITYTKISVFWAYIAVPAGAALMALQFLFNVIIKFYTLFTGKHPDPNEGKKTGYKFIDQDTPDEDAPAALAEGKEAEQA